ncbi:MAG TPA: HAMP domain-containing sensor histidine kinase [Dermatophilaceae bacterium]|nr:HAMP domain-containing sensor histidine kinase [Dermatophilaceae bacterium]
MTSAETQVAQGQGQGSVEAKAAPPTDAILANGLEVGDERPTEADNQRALMNILEDIDSDRIRLEATQSAILNILDDFDAERRKVEEANLDLQAVNEAMRGFIAVAAHDLRSPLASIVGFSALLKESWETLTDENRLKFVATIDRQSQNLSRLVNDLLTLSSVEGGSMNTRPEAIVLEEAVLRCLDLGAGDTVNVSLSCSPDLVVWVDPDHLGRILDNFIQNAFNYGAPPVQITAERRGGMVEMRVLDHGLGVPPEFVPRLFGKFARATSPKTAAQKGTGLGLSIARALAELNGGETFYEPNVPNGSCFVVRLPSADVPQP